MGTRISFIIHISGMIWDIGLMINGTSKPFVGKSVQSKFRAMICKIDPRKSIKSKFL